MSFFGSLLGFHARFRATCKAASAGLDLAINVIQPNVALCISQALHSTSKQEAFIISISSMLVMLQVAALSLADDQVQRFSSCRFLIDGELVVSGSCEASTLGGDSNYVSFDNENVFVYLLRGEAEGFRGYWNAYESHAHTPIGMLHIDGSCWIGEAASLCLK